MLYFMLAYIHATKLFKYKLVANSICIIIVLKHSVNFYYKFWCLFPAYLLTGVKYNIKLDQSIIYCAIFVVGGQYFY